MVVTLVIEGEPRIGDVAVPFAVVRCVPLFGERRQGLGERNAAFGIEVIALPHVRENVFVTLARGAHHR